MKRLSLILRLLPAIVLATTLVGCDSSSSPTAPASPILMASVDDDLFQKVNASRSSGNVPPVRFDPDLSRIAEVHSLHMRDEGGLTHVDILGGTIRDRLEGGGVAFTRAAENIGVALGHPDPAAWLHGEFMNSAPHRKIILDANFSHVGIGYVSDGTETWVTEIFVAR